MGEESEKPGSGSRAGSGSLAPGRAREPLFDHERLQVYQVAERFAVFAARVSNERVSHRLREQFEAATDSILSNIAEGAGKMSRPDKQRYYEIARGSTTEAAAQLDSMRIRGAIEPRDYHEGRSLLIRVAQMLSRLCAGPRGALRRLDERSIRPNANANANPVSNGHGASSEPPSSQDPPAPS